MSVVSEKAGNISLESEIATSAPRRGVGPLGSYLSLDDFERAAVRKLPRAIFGYVSGGVEMEWSKRANREAFASWAFVPRVLQDVSKRSTRWSIFNEEFSAPFGIAPMGAAGFSAFRADMALAKAAKRANIPFVLSGSSFIRMEEIRASNERAWFQAYLPPGREQTSALVDRVEAAGFDKLVVTVDVPVGGNRENNVRNGYSSPMRPSLRLALDGLKHPRWLLDTAFKTLANGGIPYLENTAATRGLRVLAANAERSFTRDSMSWCDLEWLRARWKGKLLLKGVLSPADASLAREAGVDGIFVSNHGGRQLDGAVAPLDVLPAIAAEAGNMAVLFDGGIRRGTDVIKALALGADFVFIGRPFLFAAAAAHEDGVVHAVDILKEELRRNLALLGSKGFGDLENRVVPAEGNAANFAVAR